MNNDKTNEPGHGPAVSGDTPDSGRRGFIRKAIYSTPVLISLGQALGSNDASAQPCDPVFGCPPSLDPTNTGN